MLESYFPGERVTKLGVKWSRWLGALGLLLSVAGCLSPIALHRAVVEYDRAVARIRAEMLLLNIARAKHIEPLHFTAVSSVTATFGFEASGGFAPTRTDTGPLVAPFLTGTVSESPTITIVPIEGEEFTKRLLSPMDAKKVAFLFQQGVEPAVLLRLISEQLVIKNDKGVTVVRNDPVEVAQYVEFRRRVLHISSLKFWEGLYVGPIHYEEVLPISFPANSASSEILSSLDNVLGALEKGYRWKQIEGKGPLFLTKQVVGRLAITNYDLPGLPNKERRRLNIEAESLPENSLLVDIRQGGPGGDYPMHGHFLFRSFSDVLRFVANGISAVPEFDVEQDKRTAQVVSNPAQTLAIKVTPGQPKKAPFKVKHRGFWYSVSQPEKESGKVLQWNQEAFRTLSELYQMTVTDISRTPVPAITIAK